MLSRLGASFAFVMLLSCAPRGPNDAGHAGAGAKGGGRCWPVIAMRLEALEHDAEWEPVVTLAADGTITHSKHAFGHLENDRLTTGKTVISCDGSYVIHIDGSKHTARYGDGDTLLIDPMRIAVNDDGSVDMTMNGKPGPKARVVGDFTSARRTAALLAFVAVMGPPG